MPLPKTTAFWSLASSQTARKWVTAGVTDALLLKGYYAWPLWWLAPHILGLTPRCRVPRDPALESQDREIYREDLGRRNSMKLCLEVMFLCPKTISRILSLGMR